MTTATDMASPFVIVPTGSPLRTDLGRAAERTPDGLRLTATGCGVNDTHPGPFTWHRTVPADMGGQDTTDNLVDVCVPCETAIQGYLDVMRQFGPLHWPDAGVPDRRLQMTMARRAFPREVRHAV